MKRIDGIFKPQFKEDFLNKKEKKIEKDSILFEEEKKSVIENEVVRLEKKTREEKIKILLMILAFLLLCIIIFIHFYFNQKMKEILSFPFFDVYNYQKKKIDEEKIVSLDPAIQEFGIYIEKIGILAPVILEVDGTNESIYNKALEKGVAHFKGTSLPGKGSNIFIFGHSSTRIGRGAYAKVFARLGELEKGDKITIFYKKEEFSYFVFEKIVVKDDEVSVLGPTQEEQLTLMTCWPIGTDKKRLIVKASFENRE